jgi:hypothetical protein
VLPAAQGSQPATAAAGATYSQIAGGFFAAPAGDTSHEPVAGGLAPASAGLSVQSAASPVDGAQSSETGGRSAPLGVVAVLGCSFAPHAMQLVAPAAEYWPEAQSGHLEPSLLYFPAAQSSHPSRVSVGIDPGLQVAHVVSPGALVCVPGAQTSGAMPQLGALTYVPAGAGSHAVELSSDSSL